MLGYKHTAEAIEKMKLRLADKTNHPMYGKTHSPDILQAIAKPGILNPMFNKEHSLDSLCAATPSAALPFSPAP